MEKEGAGISRCRPLVFYPKSQASWRVVGTRYRLVKCLFYTVQGNEAEQTAG